MALTQISTAGVKDDAVTAGKIPADAIGSSEIAANAVGSSELADNAVDTAAIADDAVTDAKLANSINSAIAANTAKVQTTINNNADNRVITGSGTANTLNGESNLTFDGSNLGLSGDLVGSNNTTLYSSNGGSGVRAGISLSGSDQTLRFYTVNGGSERMRINSAGQLLSGTTSTNSSDANAVFAGGGNAGTNNYGKIYLSAAETNPAAGTALSFIGTSTNNVSNNAMAFIGVHSDGQHASNDYPTRFGFFTTADGASGATERLRIHNSGEVTIPAGITLGTAVTSKVASQTLDDYEEGTWSPLWSNASSGGTTVSNNMYGFYTKVGRLVTAHFHTWGLPTSGNSDAMYLQGLPFTSRTIGAVFSTVWAAYFNMGADNYYNLGVRVTENTSYARLYFCRKSSGDAVPATFNGFINYYTNFTGTITYLTT